MDKQEYESEQEEQIRDINKNELDITNKEKKSALAHGRVKKILLLASAFILVILLILSWLIFTKSGHRFIYKVAGNVIYEGLDKETDIEASSAIISLEEQARNMDRESDTWSENNINNNQLDSDIVITKKRTVPRSEDYVSNYLIFGLEEIKNAKNTDTMMIASINTKDNTIKLTSLLRDTYIEMDNHNPNKLNAFYSIGGAKGLVDVIEEMYRIKIDGYAYINFESFEKVIDYLGGISIELGEKEAKYLNEKNYISIPENRNVEPGWNVLNGNQTLGYCRIRLVETLGGANDDYGRTLRQRRVLGAIFNKYKSKNIFDLISISNEILNFIKTNVTQSQIEKALEDMVENKIIKMNTIRVPVNGAYEAPIEYNGMGYPLIVDWDANIMELYQFIYLDTEEQAEINLEKYR